jgi:hypothetical protein
MERREGSRGVKPLQRWRSEWRACVSRDSPASRRQWRECLLEEIRRLCLEHNLVIPRHRDFEDARSSIGQFPEALYDRQRLHLNLSDRTPAATIVR